MGIGVDVGLEGDPSASPCPPGHVQEELDRVLGPGRPPRPEDEQSLPYTSAVLHEVQRAITLLPHMPRCTTAPTLLGGYLLPKVGPSPHCLTWWRPGPHCPIPHDAAAEPGLVGVVVYSPPLRA